MSEPTVNDNGKKRGERSLEQKKRMSEAKKLWWANKRKQEVVPMEGPKEMKTKEKTEIATSGSSPADMIRVAVSGGMGLENLEKVLTLQERWEANEAKKAYHRAMAEFKDNPPKIDKDRKVKYKEVKYNHASLANVVDKITTELSKHGLSASWRTQQNGQVVVICRITHVMGHSEETTLQAPADTTGAKNAIQAIGSTISYLQRYSLLSILGLATSDQDDDGHGSEPEKLITEEQAMTIEDWIMSTDASRDKFLRYMGVATVEEIPASAYQKAITLFETKGKK